MTWMSSIARNAAIDVLRRRDNDALELEDEAAVAIEDVSPGPLDKLMTASDKSALVTCLDKLPSSQKQSLALAFYHGMSHAELAHHLAEPLGTVKTWVRRGLIALKACLDK